MSVEIAVPGQPGETTPDLASIGVRLSAAAAALTTGPIAPGRDEVSVAVGAVLDSYAARYQALSAEAAAFHQHFVETFCTPGS